MPRAADWDWEDVKAALRKKGTNLAILESKTGRAPKTLNRVKTKCWPEAQALIAKTLGLSPQTIWPSRYLPDGSSRTGPLPAARKSSTRKSESPVEKSGKAA